MTSQSLASDAAGHVGETFRRRREQFQVDLDTVASEIRVRPSFLAAIEEGRFAELPGATYAAGFVRTYAEYLDLDPDEMVRRFKNESASLARAAPLRFPSPMADGTVPRAALLLLGAVIAAVGYGTWYVLSTRDRTVVERVAPVPDRYATVPPPASPTPPAVPPSAPAPPPPATPAPPPPVTATPAPTVSESAPAAPTIPQTPAAPSPSVTSAPPAAPPAPTSPSAPPPGEEDAVPTSPTPAASRVVLRARADSWVEVRDPANKAVLIARVLRGGEEFAVPERPGLRLVTGNAGGLVVVVDGEALPPLGKEGTVRKGVVLEPDALRATLTPPN